MAFRLLGLLALVFGISAQAGVAEPMRRAYAPADCLEYLNAASSSGLMDWRDMVEVEHCDRIKRLQRISELTLGAEPQFYDATIAADRLPQNIGVRIPLLRVVFPERVFFDTDSSRLRPEAWGVARIVAENLQHELPDVVVFVAGHADERGESAYNQNLSIDRANALAEAILGYGVNVASVWRIGFGEDMPLAAGSNEVAWGQNRRIEFLFAAKPEPVAVWLADQQVEMLCQGKTAKETSKCKKQLDFKKGYEAVEVVVGKQTVFPTDDKNGVDGTAGTKTAIDPGKDSSGVETGNTKTTIQIKPQRKIFIDPANRRVGEIESN
ncbi:OmpA family protein [Hyphomonas sp. NPDC076900]|uniref:OmpA family protein n=1 Tax=unclassified Hyphomonas TaxID=2630699 RepID=UPI003CFECE44